MAAEVEVAEVVGVEEEAEAPDAVPARIRSQHQRSHLRHRPPGNRFRIPCWNWSRPRPRFRNPIRHRRALQLPPRLECIPVPPASTSIQRPSKGPRVPSRKLLVFFARIPLDCVEPRPIQNNTYRCAARDTGTRLRFELRISSNLIRYCCRPRPAGANTEPESSLRLGSDYGTTSEEKWFHLPLS